MKELHANTEKSKKVFAFQHGLFSTCRNEKDFFTLVCCVSRSFTAVIALLSSPESHSFEGGSRSTSYTGSQLNS